MSKPRLLDLCCKAGGAGAGFARAGFDVTGVDIEPQPHYPHRFIQADALLFPLQGYDFVHASVPCQHFSQATQFHGTQDNHPDLIDPMRRRLQFWGGLWIMENVERAPLAKHLMLCGTMFGLRTIRHRIFELSDDLFLFHPHHPAMCPKAKGHKKSKHKIKVAGPGAIARGDEYWSVGGHFGEKERAQREALGIDWMKTQEEIANAIPPAYTQFIGEQVIALLRNK